jgi:hypothetical protein
MAVAARVDLLIGACGHRLFIGEYGCSRVMSGIGKTRREGQSWATSLRSWKSPNGCWHDLVGERLQPRSGWEHAPARIAPAAGEKRSAGGGKQAPTMWLSDATLKAVQVRGQGAAANEVLSYLAREFWITVRPNHLGIALQRHRRAGRLENRDQRWYLPPSA